MQLAQAPFPGFAGISPRGGRLATVNPSPLGEWEITLCPGLDLQPAELHSIQLKIRSFYNISAAPSQGVVSMRPIGLILALAFQGFATCSAFAIPSSSHESSGRYGAEKLCVGRDGKVYTESSRETCLPFSYYEIGPRDFIRRPQDVYPQSGLKVKEYVDGSIRICVYDILGKSKTIRMVNLEACPLTFDL